LLAISLPNLNGIDVAKQIFQVIAGTKILFLTAKSEVDVVRAALSTGGAGIRPEERCRK
jgi:DNA-binding NarL/FixJ family response regulator